MDIHRIALYLAGKFSPYYQAPFDKLELLEMIRDHFYKEFPDDLFNLVDSESFYSMALNKVQRQDSKDKTEKLKEIIQTLNVPEDAGGLKKSDLIGEKSDEGWPKNESHISKTTNSRQTPKPFSIKPKTPDPLKKVRSFQILLSNSETEYEFWLY